MTLPKVWLCTEKQSAWSKGATELLLAATRPAAAGEAATVWPVVKMEDRIRSYVSLTQDATVQGSWSWSIYIAAS